LLDSSQESIQSPSCKASGSLTNAHRAHYTSNIAIPIHVHVKSETEQQGR
jgi:hypothetical protein